MSLRPEWMPKGVLRSYYTAGSMRHVMAIDGRAPSTFIARRSDEGRPIPSVYTRRSDRSPAAMVRLYQPLAVLAAARADVLQVGPPEDLIATRSVVDLRDEKSRLEEQIAHLKGVRAVLQETGTPELRGLDIASAALTSRRLLTHAEIVAKANEAGRERLVGVYFLVCGGEVVYVGQSVDIHARLGSHRGSKAFDAVAYVPCEQDKLNALESLYIHALRPALNSKHASGEHAAPISWARLIEHTSRLSNGD